MALVSVHPESPDLNVNAADLLKQGGCQARCERRL